MGNCIEKQPSPPPPPPSSKPPSHSVTATRSQSPPLPSPSLPIVRLRGSASSPLTSYLRFALSYKPITLRFSPSSTSSSDHSVLYTLETEEDAVSGTAESVLEYVEARFPHPPVLVRRNRRRQWGEEEEDAVVVRMARLQHRSMRWHVEKVTKLGTDLAAGNGGGKVKAAMEAAAVGVEVRRMGKRYEMLLEVMLEHAQMEERVVFPVLQASDPGLCKCANEEHGRDLPIMNGIKEAIKSIVALDAGTPDFREALYNLSSRLETLQENCRKHFEEEEKYVFPMMEATEETTEQERRMFNQCIDSMPATHSHLFSFFIEGLLPQEAMQYLELLLTYDDQERAAQMLRTLIEERHFKRLRHSLGEVLQHKEDHFANK